MNRNLRRPVADERTASQRVYLGPLEVDVMDVVWRLGTGNVREVAAKMERNLAYTTIMTTLDRLYKKGMLVREMTDRAFIYSAKVTREEMDRQRAGEMMAGFLSGPEESRQLLLSCLVDAVGTHDAMLLDELERKIHNKRQELAKKR
jgi:predicted transcriptional regulator